MPNLIVFMVPLIFINREDGRGQCHKMTPDLLLKIQEKIDAGVSNYQIAKDYHISDSAIGYHLQKGTLKKKKSQSVDR